LDKKEINVNVNRIKPFITTNLEQLPEPQIETPATPTTTTETEQKEEEQPWIEVKRKPKSAPQQLPKRGRGRPKKNMGPPKDKVIQLEPRWTRARAARQKEEEQAQKEWAVEHEF
jgi:hypothetical protein